MAKYRLDRKREDIAEALKHGWHYVRHSGSGHMLFEHPNGGGKLVLAGSPGGGRGGRNAVAWVRKNTPREATA